MKTINPNIKIDVKKTMLAILQQRPITKRFNLPVTREQGNDLLKAFVMAEVARRQMVFIENKFLDRQIGLMAEWLTTSDHRFCALLFGQSGNGKSTLVKALQKLISRLDIKDEYGQTIGLRIIDARDIAWMCRDKHEEWRALTNRNMLAIDDLGTEPVEVKYYGNQMNPVIDLLYKRYDEQLFTVITTNLTPNGIKERYGDRIIDRFREMCFHIDFENKSYRII